MGRGRALCMALSFSSVVLVGLSDRREEAGQTLQGRKTKGDRQPAKHRHWIVGYRASAHPQPVEARGLLLSFISNGL